MESNVHRRPLHRDVTSKSVFRAAEALSKKCMNPDKPHKRCQYSRDTVLPTRVLDVGNMKSKVPNGSNPKVRLKVNTTITHAPYLAPSYCRGEQPEPRAPVQPLLLRKDTLRDLMNEVKPENLQKSIADAVFVTRELGFRNLWIDALCLIQDCPIDKAKEISRMTSIYKNAAITMAASSSEKAADGFLFKRVLPYLPECVFHMPGPGGESSMSVMYLSAEAREPEHPLDMRGWALQ
ncbi:hypothetical protein CDD83_5879 [Cordyceps sp. RAO-2017]|nr:hypothetical protein CDD83_5879 [Cordyceps sp. RAO-2017]